MRTYIYLTLVIILMVSSSAYAESIKERLDRERRREEGVTQADGSLPPDQIIPIEKDVVYDENGRPVPIQKLRKSPSSTVKYKKQYYENGKLKSKTRFYNNKKEGKTIHYYENGQELSILEYLSDQLVYGTMFYENGATRAEVSYYKGKRHGMTRIFYENGEINFEAEYEEDNLVTAREFSADGEEIKRNTYYVPYIKKFANDTEYWGDSKPKPRKNAPARKPKKVPQSLKDSFKRKQQKKSSQGSNEMTPVRVTTRSSSTSGVSAVDDPRSVREYYPDGSLRYEAKYQGDKLISEKEYPHVNQ